jgi:hypothetical protein
MGIMIGVGRTIMRGVGVGEGGGIIVMMGVGMIICGVGVGEGGRGVGVNVAVGVGGTGVSVGTGVGVSVGGTGVGVFVGGTGVGVFVGGRTVASVTIAWGVAGGAVGVAVTTTVGSRRQAIKGSERTTTAAKLKSVGNLFIFKPPNFKFAGVRCFSNPGMALPQRSE